MIFDQEIKELHKLREQYNKGNISLEKLEANLKVFEQTHKAMSNKIQAYAVAIKAHRAIRNMMEKDGLVGYGAFLQISSGSYETELIPCIGQDNALITRAKCLDYSGSNKFPECLCGKGKETKDLLLPSI